MKFHCDNFENNICKSCSLLEPSAQDPIIQNTLIDLAAVTKDWVKTEFPFGLRSKARIIVTNDNNRIRLGILDKNLLGVSLTNCPLHRPLINTVLEKLSPLIERFDISIYSINKRIGELKNIILQTTSSESAIRVRFQMRSTSEIAKIEQLILVLSKELEVKLSASVNIQPIPNQIAEGEEEIHLFGDELIWENYNGIDVAFPSQSFMQVTPEIASRLYFDASEIVKKVNSEKVLDLFCGAGGFALNVAHHATKVLGVDISKSAIEAATISAAKNKITNCDFKAFDLLNNLDILNQFNPDVLICNPPRRGLGEMLINAIIENPPETIIYSSCNSISFLKDFVKIANIYTIKEVTPYEMFPLTNHFETLAYLSRI